MPRQVSIAAPVNKELWRKEGFILEASITTGMQVDGYIGMHIFIPNMSRACLQEYMSSSILILS